MIGKKNTIGIPLKTGYKVISASPSRTVKPHTPGIKVSKHSRVSANRFNELNTAGSNVQRIQLNAQHELNLARQIRAKAERYSNETTTSGRSQVQRLILKARLETEKELAEFKRMIDEELQKSFSEIRMIRIMAREELEVQRKISNVARTKALSMTSKKKFAEKLKKAAESIGPAT